MSKKKELRNRRPLDEIAAEICALQRLNVFAIGALLLEAKETHPGEFLDWLHENEQEFGSVSSAERYMDAARLAARFVNLTNLKVAKTTIYALVAFDKDHPKLTEIAIGTLAAQTKGARLRADDAKEIMDLVRLRAKFGSHPDATLNGLERIATTRRPEPWHSKTTETLKAKRPETEEAADAIVLGVLQEHVEGLYGRALPALHKEHAESILEELARVSAEDRARVLGRLEAAKAPVTEAMVYEATKPEFQAPDFVPAAGKPVKALDFVPGLPVFERLDDPERERRQREGKHFLADWSQLNDEQQSAFVNTVGLVKLYELASDAQRKQLEAHFPTTRWKKANGLEGVKTTIDGMPVPELPPPE
jgi:hypothetical protein